MQNDGDELFQMVGLIVFVVVAMVCAGLMSFAALSAINGDLAMAGKMALIALAVGVSDVYLWSKW